MMILPRCLLTLLGTIALQSTGNANFQGGSDEQTCIAFCNNCEGRATFEDEVCECHVADDNQRGIDCISRIKRQAGDLGFDVVSCDAADPEADRAARCIVSPFRRFRHKGDADLIANYFMGHGLGNLGSLLGSSKSRTNEKAATLKDPYTPSQVEENVGEKKQSNDKDLDSDSDSDSAIVGASNSLVGASPTSGQFMNGNPLLEAAAAWLQPNTLLAMRNGFQGLGTQGFVAQQNQGATSGSEKYNGGMDSMQANFVGSPYQDTSGNFLSTGTQNSYSPYTIGGMSPYPYIVGASNPIQPQDGLQGLPMQSYSYDNYNSVVGAQNPFFPGLYPYSNCGASLVGADNPQTSDPTAVLESSSDKGTNVDKELIGEPKPESNIEAEGITDSEDKLEPLRKEMGEAVVGSEQTLKNSKKVAGNQAEMKSESSGPFKRSTK